MYIFMHFQFNNISVLFKMLRQSFIRTIWNNLLELWLSVMWSILCKIWFCLQKVISNWINFCLPLFIFSQLNPHSRYMHLRLGVDVKMAFGVNLKSNALYSYFYNDIRPPKSSSTSNAKTNISIQYSESLIKMLQRKHKNR